MSSHWNFMPGMASLFNNISVIANRDNDLNAKHVVKTFSTEESQRVLSKQEQLRLLRVLLKNKLYHELITKAENEL